MKHSAAQLDSGLGTTCSLSVASTPALGCRGGRMVSVLQKYFPASDLSTANTSSWIIDDEGLKSRLIMKLPLDCLTEKRFQ